MAVFFVTPKASHKSPWFVFGQNSTNAACCSSVNGQGR
jgi:hypothetical protein